MSTNETNQTPESESTDYSIHPDIDNCQDIAKMASEIMELLRDLASCKNDLSRYGRYIYGMLDGGQKTISKEIWLKVDDWESRAEVDYLPVGFVLNQDLSVSIRTCAVPLRSKAD